MKHNKILFLLSLLTLLLSSCNDMWEEKTNSEWEPKYAWEVARIAQGVLYNAYSAIENRPDSYGSNFLDAATDNALTSQYSSSVYALTSGKLSSTNNPIGLWNKVYTQFQYINLFLENGLTDATKYNMVDPDMDASYKTRLKGEAFFLRAYWGFRMLQMYGGKVKTGEALGYPLALHFMSEEDAMDYSQIKRNTYQECAEQIMLDCDTAAELLPASYAGNDPVLGATEIGRATKIAAMALKSIVALYAASPAYQSDDVISLTGMGQFSVLDEEKYKILKFFKIEKL